MLAPLLLIATPVQAAPFDVKCTYSSRSEKELVVAPDCARRDRALRFNPARLIDFAFTRGLSDVNIGGHWYYVRDDGLSQPVVTFENWADEFHSGLARSEVADKIGYIDTRLRLVLPRRYDGAYPFEKGRALVCFGCTLESDGEHHYYAGGIWTCINPRGHEIRPRIKVFPNEGGAAVCD